MGVEMYLVECVGLIVKFSIDIEYYVIVLSLNLFLHATDMIKSATCTF